MKFSVPNAGQPIVPFISQSSMWAAILRMVNDYEQGKLGTGSISNAVVCQPIGINAGASMLERGTLQRVKDVRYEPAAPDAAVDLMTQYKSLFTLEAPVWHTKIDSVFPLLRSVYPSGNVPITSMRFIPAKVHLAATSKANDRYAMVDPTQPTRLVAADAGIFKIVGDYALSTTRKLFVVDTMASQPIWRYELTQNSQAPSDTTAKLLRLDGDQFAASINLSDPDGLMDNQVSGNRGWCIHIGNKFYAIQAVC